MRSIESDCYTSRSVASLSGGERTRLGLAAMLLEEPHLLLMDEPTNNLDGEGRDIIVNLREDWSGGAVIASHDRELLERMDRIVQLSPVGIFSVKGGLSAFLAEREAMRERLESELARAERGLRQQGLAVQHQKEEKARRDKTRWQPVVWSPLLFCYRPAAGGSERVQWQRQDQSSPIVNGPFGTQ